MEVTLVVPMKLYELFSSMVGLLRWDYPSAVAFLQNELLNCLESAIACYFEQMPNYQELLETTQAIIEKVKKQLKERY